jgi:LytS/YehU family sensor histidine kinase
LGELLRASLESTTDQEVTLEAELSFLARYLDIEQIRFGERLRVRREIDPSTLAHPVPNLILQPLVENAIQHGISKRARPGLITLRSRRSGEHLVLEVEDNGGSFENDEIVLRSGVGLSNTRERLKQLYGPESLLEFRRSPESGLLVRLRIPWKP